MEQWQTDRIRKNLSDLLRLTTCSVVFLSHFRADGLVSEEEDDILCQMRNARNQTMTFYNIIQTRSRSFNLLKQALSETSQTGAFTILEKCLQEENVTLQYHGAIGFGRGCFGTTVFLGKFGSRDVAVKKIYISTGETAEKIAKEEVKFLKDLDWHENVVRLFEMVETEDFILIALELCDTNLHDWVMNPKTERNIVIGEVEVITQSARGIGHLHKNRVVHRDLKPANILMVRQATGDIRVKISDFGMAKKIPDGESKMTVHSSGVGTEGWMAPEVIAYQQERPFGCVLKMGIPSDIFSLGCIFYFVLTEGVHPFGDTFVRQGRIIKGKWKLQEEHIKILQIDHFGFIRLVREMIAKEEAARPQISEVIDCLAELSKKKIYTKGRSIGKMEASKEFDGRHNNGLNKYLDELKLEKAVDKKNTMVVSDRAYEYLSNVSDAEEWMAEQWLCMMVEDRGTDEISAQILIKEHEARENDINNYTKTIRKLREAAGQLMHQEQLERDNNILLKQAKLERQYSGLKDLAQERHLKLKDQLKFFMLDKEINDFNEWVARCKKGVTCSIENYAHTPMSRERFKEFTRETESIGIERVALLNEMSDDLIFSKHSHSPIIVEWKDRLNKTWADLLELIDTQTVILSTSNELHKFFRDCKNVLCKISEKQTELLDGVGGGAGSLESLWKKYSQFKQQLNTLKSKVEQVQQDSKKLQEIYKKIGGTVKDGILLKETGVVNAWMELKELCVEINKKQSIWKEPINTPNEIGLETIGGFLKRKHEWESKTEKASNRSWDNIYVAVRGGCAEVASDYTKKKHVFRLKISTGAQYLFQAQSDIEMLRWVSSINGLIIQREAAGENTDQPNTREFFTLKKK